MKVIKLNNAQAKKIAGTYGKIWAIDPLFVENDFWVCNTKLAKGYNELKRFIARKTKLGLLTVIDMSVPSPQVDKIKDAYRSPSRARQLDYRGHIGKL